MAVQATTTHRDTTNKTTRITGTLAFTGSYATGGDTLNFGAATMPIGETVPEGIGVPKRVTIDGANGFTYGYVPGTTRGNGLVKVTQPVATRTPIVAGSVATATLSALTSNVATVTAANTFAAGQFVVLQGFANAGFADLNGLTVQIASASATQYTFNYTHADVASGADVAGTATQLTSANGPVYSMAAVASTNSVLTSNVATITVANTFKPGDFVVMQGFANAAATAFNGLIVQVITASATQFTFNFNHANITTGADTGTVALVVTPGNVPVAAGPAIAITNTVVASNVLALSAVQQVVPGAMLMIQGLTAGAALNGQLVSVISTSLTNALFKANLKTANIGTAADSGVAVPLVVGASSSPAELGAAAYPAGVTGDTVTFEAIFSKGA